MPPLTEWPYRRLVNVVLTGASLSVLVTVLCYLWWGWTAAVIAGGLVIVLVFVPLRGLVVRWYGAHTPDGS